MFTQKHDDLPERVDYDTIIGNLIRKCADKS